MSRQIVPLVGFASAEPTESAIVSGRQKQSLRAAWWPRRPRVAVALTAQATTRLSTALSPQHPPALSRASIFAFRLLLRRWQRPQQQRRSPPSPLPVTGWPSRFSITATAPPPPQHPTAPPSARCSSSVSSSPTHSLVGASDYSGVNGGAEVRVDGVTPVEATAN